MSRQSMSDREALRRIRPTSRTARRQLLGIVGFLVFAIAAVAGLLYAKHRIQQYREQNWYSAIGTVEDVRMKLVATVDTKRGGALLYDVEVLARFPFEGSERERWIAVQQRPEDLAYAQFQSRMWRGKKYFVRWNPSNPNQIVIEIN